MTDFDRLLPPLATLVVFDAAYRHQSFSRAADALFMSQATVSRRIRELETDLGVPLFERHRYDVTPTADGEALAVSVRLSLTELSTTADAIRRRGSDSQSLTVLSDPSLASVWVAPILGDYQRKHPELSIRVIASCESPETASESFDVALQYGRAEASSYDVEFIADEAVFPVCSPAFADTLSPSMTAADLARLPLLHVEYADPGWTTWPQFLRYLEVENDVEDASTELVFTSYNVGLDVAEQGEGVALGWQRSVQARIDAGTLVRISGFAMPKAGVINAYLPRVVGANPFAPEFVSLLKETLRSTVTD